MTELTHILSDTIARLPWTAHAVALVVLVAGLVLWFTGEKMLRFLVSGVGLVVGGFMGWSLVTAIGLPMPLWVGAIAGAAATLVVFLAVLRFAVAISLGATLAIIAPLIVVSGITANGSPLRDGSSDRFGPLDENSIFLQDVPIESAEIFSKNHLFGGYWRPFENGENTPENAPNPPEKDASKSGEEPISDKVERLAGSVWSELAYVWNSQPTRDRGLLLLALVSGGAIGLAVGMVLPKKAAALVAAGLGAAMWLGAAVWLAHGAGIAPRVPLGDDPRLWLGIWVGISILGAGFQWIGSRRRADNTSTR